MKHRQCNLNLFVTNSQIHCYSTRTDSNYRTHLCRTSLKQFRILYQNFLSPLLFQSLFRQIFLALRRKYERFYLNNH